MNGNEENTSFLTTSTQGPGEIIDIAGQNACLCTIVKDLSHHKLKECFSIFKSLYIKLLLSAEVPEFDPLSCWAHPLIRLCLSSSRFLHHGHYSQEFIIFLWGSMCLALYPMDTESNLLKIEHFQLIIHSGFEKLNILIITFLPNTQFLTWVLTGKIKDCKIINSGIITQYSRYVACSQF